MVRVFGMGIPELIVIVVIVALMAYVFYWLIKKAVAKGTLAAQKKLNEEKNERKS